MRKATAVAVATLLASCLGAGQAMPAQSQQLCGDTINDSRVQVTLYVMSRCPDALRCETLFNSVLSRVSGIVTVAPSFIGKLDGPKKNQTVECMHGPLECEGDKQQLCVYLKTPKHVNYAWFWGFVRCQDENFHDVGDAGLAAHCLQSAGIPEPDARDMQTCYSGPEGAGLLRASVQASSSQGVHTSCTIFLDGEHRCAVDGGVYKDCPGGSEVEDFVHSICKLYVAKNGCVPPECTSSGQAGAWQPQRPRMAKRGAPLPVLD